MPVTPEMEKEVAALRQQIHHVLQAAQKSSEKSGKPLLIIVGESHGTANSLVLESIIYQEARALGVTDVALEQPNKIRPFLADNNKVAPICRSYPEGALTILRQAEYFGDTLHLVDSRIASAKLSDHELKPRNETMAANLDRIVRPTVMIAGEHHLTGLMRRMDNFASHEVVGFDIDPRDETQTMLKAIAPYGFVPFQFDKFDLERPKSNAHVLKVEHNLNALDIDSMLMLGMGEKMAPDFIRWTEKQGYKKSHAELLNLLTQYEAYPAVTRQENPAPNHLSHHAVLYELGRDVEAGKLYAHNFALGTPLPLELTHSTKFDTALWSERNKLNHELILDVSLNEAHTAAPNVPKNHSAQSKHK